MKNYTHFSEEERNQLVVMVNRGNTIRSIATKLGRHHSSVSREIKRNFGKRRYRAHQAQKRAVERQRNSHKKGRLKSHALRLEVEQMLMQRFTPEQIAGRIPIIHPELPTISHEAIYQWIYRERPHLIGYLPRQHKQRWPKGKGKGRRALQYRIPQRVPLTHRSDEANNRSQVGHWETDLIIGSGKSALQVSVERVTRYVKLARIADKSPSTSCQSLIDSFATVPSYMRRSITYDNGIENFEHYRVNKELTMVSFFCEPYHSWEKGTVENTNGIIRRLFPKRTNFDTIPLSDIQTVETWLNNRPRKCLLFFTPSEAFARAVALGP
jgi:IS30 family transposase